MNTERKTREKEDLKKLIGELEIQIGELEKAIETLKMEIAEMEKPQRQMFACFAEAMLLEFEGCHTNFSWGRNNITLEKMDFIGAASVRHGFSTLNLQGQPQAVVV